MHDPIYIDIPILPLVSIQMETSKFRIFMGLAAAYLYVSWII